MTTTDQTPVEVRRDYHTKQRLAVRVDSDLRAWYHDHRGEAKAALETYRELVRVAGQYGLSVEGYLHAASAIAHPILRETRS